MQCVTSDSVCIVQAPLVKQQLYNTSATGKEAWAPIFDFLGAHLVGKDWLVGSELTVSDIAIG